MYKNPFSVFPNTSEGIFISALFSCPRGSPQKGMDNIQKTMLLRLCEPRFVPFRDLNDLLRARFVSLGGLNDPLRPRFAPLRVLNDPLRPRFVPLRGVNDPLRPRFMPLRRLNAHCDLALRQNHPTIVFIKYSI